MVLTFAESPDNNAQAKWGKGNQRKSSLQMAMREFKHLRFCTHGLRNNPSHHASLCQTFKLSKELRCPFWIKSAALRESTWKVLN